MHMISVEVKLAEEVKRYVKQAEEMGPKNAGKGEYLPISFNTNRVANTIRKLKSKGVTMDDHVLGDDGYPLLKEWKDDHTFIEIDYDTLHEEKNVDMCKLHPGM